MLLAVRLKWRRSVVIGRFEPLVKFGRSVLFGSFTTLIVLFSAAIMLPMLVQFFISVLLELL